MTKKIAKCLFLFLFLFMPVQIHADTQSPVDKLNEISDEALQMTKATRYSDANKLLLYFSELFIRLDQRPFSMDELRVVTVAHNEALEATANEALGHEEVVNKVTKFRLVMDAINSSQQPLWAEMETPILETFAEVKDAATRGETDQFNLQLNEFLSLYQMIYPSMKLDISTETIQSLDTKIDYVDQYRPKVLADTSSQKELDVIETDLKNIFARMNEDEADPSLWWVIITTGSIIVLTLSYVGFRKYKGESEQVRSTDRSREQKD